MPKSGGNSAYDTVITDARHPVGEFHDELRKQGYKYQGSEINYGAKEGEPGNPGGTPRSRINVYGAKGKPAVELHAHHTGWHPDEPSTRPGAFPGETMARSYRTKEPKIMAMVHHPSGAKGGHGPGVEGMKEGISTQQKKIQ